MTVMDTAQFATGIGMTSGVGSGNSEKVKIVGAVVGTQLVDAGSPIAEVFAHGVRKWGKPSVDVEQAIIDGGERQVGSLR